MRGHICLACAALSAVLATPAQAQNLYVANNYTGASIYEFTPSGVQSTVATGFTFPLGLAFDNAGNLYVGNQNNFVVRIAPGGTQSTFATAYLPQGLAFDKAGNLYVSSYGDDDIIKVTPSRQQSVFASGLAGPAGLAFDNS